MTVGQRHGTAPAEAIVDNLGVDNQGQTTDKEPLTQLKFGERNTTRKPDEWEPRIEKKMPRLLKQGRQ